MKEPRTNAGSGTSPAPASPAPGPPEHVLLYDSICPICRRSVELLRARGLLERAEARPLEEPGELGLSGEELEGVRSEMLLHSRLSGESFRGFDALLKLLELHGKARLLVRAAGAAPLRALGRAAYRFIALNRRILSPPPTRGAACACDPPYRPGWRAALLAALAAALAGGFFLHGLAFSGVQPRAPGLELGLEALAAAGAGWLAGLAPFAALLPRRLGVIFWQSLVALSIGGALLGAFAAASPILAHIGVAPRGLTAWSLAALVTALAAVLLSTRRRHESLGLPPWAPWTWFAAFLAGALSVLVLLDPWGLIRP